MTIESRWHICIKVSISSNLATLENPTYKIFRLLSVDASSDHRANFLLVSSPPPSPPLPIYKASRKGRKKKERKTKMGWDKIKTRRGNQSSPIYLSDEVKTAAGRFYFNNWPRDGSPGKIVWRRGRCGGRRRGNARTENGKRRSRHSGQLKWRVTRGRRKRKWCRPTWKG